MRTFKAVFRIHDEETVISVEAPSKRDVWEAYPYADAVFESKVVQATCAHCDHPKGWHRKDRGACLECNCLWWTES